MLYVYNCYARWWEIILSINLYTLITRWQQNQNDTNVQLKIKTLNKIIIIDQTKNKCLIVQFVNYKIIIYIGHRFDHEIVTIINEVHSLHDTNIWWFVNITIDRN